MGKSTLALCVVACAIYVYPHVSGYWTNNLSLTSAPKEKFVSTYSNPAEVDAEDCGLVQKLLQAHLQHFPAFPFDWDSFINETCARQAMVSLLLLLVRKIKINEGPCKDSVKNNFQLF